MTTPQPIDCFIVQAFSVMGTPMEIYLNDMTSLTKDAWEAFRLPNREAAEERAMQANGVTTPDQGIEWRATEHVFLG